MDKTRRTEDFTAEDLAKMLQDPDTTKVNITHPLAGQVARLISVLIHRPALIARTTDEANVGNV